MRINNIIILLKIEIEICIVIPPLNLHFRAFGAKQILKIAINAKQRERWQPLAQITRKFDLFRFIEATLI